ncbi:MAG: hypothetical protein KEFWMYNX_000862 [Candidatus Fervidibacter sp.]|jgi:hypothetical protein
MPSPFPGMDPYLEAPAGWQEFHHLFIAGIQEALVPKVRPRYAVHIERYVYLTALDAEATRLHPDVSVAQTSPEAPRTESAVVTLTETTTAILVPLPVIEEVRHYFLEIRELTTQRVVTVIEMLSPFNKRLGDGRTEYLKRRNAILNSDAHLIELDLLREGERMPMGKPLPPADYYAIVSRSYRRPMAEVYAWTVRQKMPTIPVPLLWGEPDVPLDLQAVLTTVYERAGYDYRLPYQRDPEPPLRAEEAEWARELINQWRKRMQT